MKIKLGKLKRVIREAVESLKEFDDVGYVEDPKKMQSAHNDFDRETTQLYVKAQEFATERRGEFSDDMAEDQSEHWLQDASTFIDQNAKGPQQRSTALNWLTNDFGAPQR